MTKKGDTYLSIPANLSDRIKENIENSYGSYKSISEFVRSAIREKIERLENSEFTHQPKVNTENNSREDNSSIH